MGNYFSSNTDTTVSTIPTTSSSDSNLLQEKEKQILELQQKLHEMESKVNKTHKKRRRSFSSISVLDDSNNTTTLPYEHQSEFLVDPKLLGEEDDEDTLNVTVGNELFLRDSSSPEIWKKQKLLTTEDGRNSMVLAISGFKQSSEHIYNRNVKKRICHYIEKSNLSQYTSNGVTIPVQILKEDNSKPTETLDDSITHIICPPQSRTFKVLQAVLTHKWIICPEWVVQSYVTGRWLHESGFGFKRIENPIENRCIYLSPSFDLYCNSSKASPNYIPNLKDHCTGLARIGRAVIVNDAEHADYILVGPSMIATADDFSEEVIHENKEKSKYSALYPKVYVLEWAEFIELLYPQYLEASLRKAAELYPISE